MLLDNLPGYPDNLMRGLDGRIWLGFAKPRNAIVDGMAGKPCAARGDAAPATGAVAGAAGLRPRDRLHAKTASIVADLQDPSGAYPETTAITETPDRLYVQSLHATSLGWLPRPEIKP